MEHLTAALLFAVGVALVVKGGDWFVSAAVAVAERARLPKALVGGTLVSLATTAPEFAVSATASVQGNPGLAIGNAVGSVICNIGLIVGVLCILHPMAVDRRDFRFPVLFMLGARVLLTGLTWTLALGPSHGAALVALAVVYLLADYARHRRRAPAREGPPPGDAARVMRLPRALGLFALGAAVVVLGSRLLADNAVRIASALGVPQMVIGLTLVAVGTSLPELVTAIASARKGVPELSLGNAVGANIMNMTLVTGTSALIHPLEMTRAMQLYNFPAMLVFSVALLALARTGGALSRREGVVLILLYAGYVAGLAATGG